jgi:hypothetical protein
MMMSSQRARGPGHRAFYLHPEPTAGGAGSPSGTTKTGGGTSSIEAIPEDTAAEAALETETAEAAQ